MAKQDQTTDEVIETKEGKKGLPVKMILVVFSVLLILGTAGALYKSGILGGHAEENNGPKAMETGRAPAEPGPVHTLETFIVNLADERGTRYLKTRLGLELSRPEVAREIEQRLPQVRDAILTILSTKAFEDIRSLEGKHQLRAEIAATINLLLVSGEVTNIYFTEFVVQ